MKLAGLLLVCSLLANFALLLVVRGRASSQLAPRITAPASPSGFNEPEIGRDSRVDVRAESWSVLAATGPEDLVTGLRAHGFPPAVVRAILQAEVRERFAPRYRDLARKAAAVPYWRGEPDSLAADPALERERRKLDREVSEIVMQMLGPSAEELSEPARNAFRRQYGDLAPEKIAEMKRVQADYVDLMAAVRTESRGIMLPDDAAKLAFLEKEMRADLERLLTPEELESIDLHSSKAAEKMRTALSAFRPTEEEFRALFRIQQAIDSRFGDAQGSLTPEQRRLREDAKRQSAFQIEAALGAERYAEYQLKTDPAWLAANASLRQLGLPSSATTHVLGVQQDIVARARAVRTDKALTPQQRQYQLDALSREATARLSPVLGERGMVTYQRNSAGSWLRTLQARTAN